jgi:hypothetical protein
LLRWHAEIIKSRLCYPPPTRPVQLDEGDARAAVRLMVVSQ